MIGLECTCKGEYSTGEWLIHCIPCPDGTIYTWHGCVACPNGHIEVDGVCVFGTYTYFKFYLDSRVGQCTHLS